MKFNVLVMSALLMIPAGLSAVTGEDLVNAGKEAALYVVSKENLQFTAKVATSLTIISFVQKGLRKVAPRKTQDALPGLFGRNLIMKDVKERIKGLEQFKQDTEARRAKKHGATRSRSKSPKKD